MKSSATRPTAFVLTATNHGTMLVNRHDYVEKDNMGYGVGYQLLNTSAFDQEEVDLALNLLESRKVNYGAGVVAIDCGANVGVHTIEWAKFMHGWGQVVAFEAQERIFYALAGNITLNNCFNARAIWAAVGATSGEIGVPMPDYFVPSSFGSLELRKTANTEFIGQVIDYSALQSTRMVAIDELNVDRLDFMKIDIEGMELDGLRGARKTLARHTPQLMIEKIKSDEAAITKFLTDLGYSLIPLGINVLALHRSDPLATKMQAQ